MIHKPIINLKHLDHLWKESNRLCPCGEPVRLISAPKDSISCLHYGIDENGSPTPMPLRQFIPGKECYWCFRKKEIARTAKEIEERRIKNAERY